MIKMFIQYNFVYIIQNKDYEIYIVLYLYCYKLYIGIYIQLLLCGSVG